MRRRSAVPAGGCSGGGRTGRGGALAGRGVPPSGPGGPSSAGRAAARAGALILGAAALALGAAGCASRGAVPLRESPVAYADTLPIPEPKARGERQIGRLFELSTTGIGHGLAFRQVVGEQHPATNLTRFDDVRSSSWFRHRNGRRRLAPSEVARGPGDTRPDTRRIVVTDAKESGVSPGLTVKDARGVKFVMKLDPEGHLHLSSAAEVIASRLFWAAGYHVPETVLVTFRPEQLVIGEDATVTGPRGERPMRREDLREVLSLTDPLPDGRYLAVCSRFVPGTPKGPWLFEGTRDDDPNDYYPHQHRRELRGLFVVSSWLNHVDTRFMNTLSSYVEPGYLRHYLIDFGSALGSAGVRPHGPREGDEYNVDFWTVVGRLVTLGFYREGWEGADPESIHPSVGWLPVQGFEPGEWKPNWPNEAYHSMTAADGYWGAKLVGSFTDAQIRAAVEKGRLPTDAAADTLTEIIQYRRDRVVEHWYSRVTPLEDPEAGPVRSSGPDGRRTFELRFRDLGLAEGVWTAEETRYRWRFRHAATGTQVSGTARARPGGDRQAITVSLPAGAVPEGGRPSGEAALARVAVTARRPGASGRPARVWLRWEGPDRGYRAAGLRH